MSRPLAFSHVDSERATSRVQQAAWTLALSAALGCAGALATAQTAPPAPPPLVAELADFVEMPRTPAGEGRCMAARVNVLIEEPGSGRLFVAEHAGPLSIVDKTTRKAVTYINFNGLPDSPGAVSEVRPDRRVCQRAHGLRLRSGLPTQRHVLHHPSGGSGAHG